MKWKSLGSFSYLFHWKPFATEPISQNNEKPPPQLREECKIQVTFLTPFSIRRYLLILAVDHQQMSLHSWAVLLTLNPIFPFSRNKVAVQTKWLPILWAAGPIFPCIDRRPYRCNIRQVIFKVCIKLKDWGGTYGNQNSHLHSEITRSPSHQLSRSSLPTSGSNKAEPLFPCQSNVRKSQLKQKF